MEEIAIGIKDAAKAVGLSVWTLRAWVRQGKVKAVRLGRRVLVEPGELRRLVALGRSGGGHLRRLLDEGGEEETQ